MTEVLKILLFSLDCLSICFTAEMYSLMFKEALGNNNADTDVTWSKVKQAAS